MRKHNIIYDFESLDIFTEGVVLSIGILYFDIDTEYTIEELVKNTKHFKFKVSDLEIPIFLLVLRVQPKSTLIIGVLAR